MVKKRSKQYYTNYYLLRSPRGRLLIGSSRYYSCKDFTSKLRPQNQEEKSE